MANQSDPPHGPWSHRLKNGAKAGNPTKAPRCSAKSKRTKKACGSPSMKNGKCYHHGGASTGPRTEIGKAKSRRANWKHGEYSAESKQMVRAMRDLLKGGS